MSKSYSGHLAAFVALGKGKNATRAGREAGANVLFEGLYIYTLSGQNQKLMGAESDLGGGNLDTRLKALLSDLWDQARAVRDAAKSTGKLDTSGKWVGLNRGNLFIQPAGVYALIEEVFEALKAERSEARAAREAKAKAEAEAEAKADAESPTIIMAIDNEGKPADVPTLPDEEAESLRQQLTLARLELAEAHKALAEAREAVLAARTIKQARAVFEQAA